MYVCVYVCMYVWGNALKILQKIEQQACQNSPNKQHLNESLGTTCSQKSCDEICLHIFESRQSSAHQAILQQLQDRGAAANSCWLECCLRELIANSVPKLLGRPLKLASARALVCCISAIEMAIVLVL